MNHDCIYFFIREQFSNVSTPANNYIIANFATGIFVTLYLYMFIFCITKFKKIYIIKWMSLLLKTRLFAHPTKQDCDITP